jgi:hypothetical protein
MEIFLAAVLRPFVCVIVVVMVLVPVRFLVMKKVPEGRLKRVLLFKLTAD